MNRKDFFKKLGIGALAVVVAPKVLAETKETPLKLNITTAGELDPNAFKHEWHVPTKEDMEAIRSYLDAQLDADLELSRKINEAIFKLKF